MSDKVKVLVRNPYEYMRETKNEIHKVPRNHQESLHPFAQEREYIRAMNASKIQRMLSKPFIRSLNGTLDDVQVISTDPKKASLAAFGTSDGRVQYWNVSSCLKLFDFKAHDGIISGVSHFDEGNFLTCGYDKVINQWDFSNISDNEGCNKNVPPINTFHIENVPQSLSTQLFDQHFAIGTSECVLIYKLGYSNSEVYTTFGQNDRESVHYVKFHPTETNILCGLTNNNKINLFDIRQTQMSAQLKMTHKSNSMSFNPQFPVYLTTCSADYNLYTFDSRFFKNPVKIHTGHGQSVSDVCYSNRGHEFVSCSVDKTIRIFNKDDSISREIYTVKRMMRGITVRYTYDDAYILSSSSDHNVRLWKSNAAEKLGPKTPRERMSLMEADKLREKYALNPNVRKIQNRRIIPHKIKTLNNESRIMQQKRNRKERNTLVNSKPGTVEKQNKFMKSVADDQS